MLTPRVLCSLVGVRDLVEGGLEARKVAHGHGDVESLDRVGGGAAKVLPALAQGIVVADSGGCSKRTRGNSGALWLGRRARRHIDKEKTVREVWLPRRARRHFDKEKRGGGKARRGRTADDGEGGNERAHLCRREKWGVGNEPSAKCIRRAV